MEKVKQPISFFGVEDEGLEIPLAASCVKAGFPSPAEDYIEGNIDLNKLVVANPTSTFYARIDGRSMEPILSDGDLVVIDRSLTPKSNDIVLCFIDGEFTVKTIQRSPMALYLMPANPTYEPILVTPDNQLTIWGVITYSIRRHR